VNRWQWFPLSRRLLLMFTGRLGIRRRRNWRHVGVVFKFAPCRQN
jgi:hypothetical protein